MSNDLSQLVQHCFSKDLVVHYSVMRDEVFSFLKSDKHGQLLVDSTTGQGGHSKWFLEHCPDLHVVCVDADSGILKDAEKRLEEFGNRVKFYNCWFNQFFRDYPDELEKPDRILFDLGISTFHYEKSGRGFSFLKDEPLDMRLDKELEISARDIVNNYPCEDLANVIFTYGQERYSRRIAQAVLREREKGKIETTGQLSSIIRSAVPAEYRRCRLNPATRTFQALRIAVNGELARLQEALADAISVLKVGGVMGVITFHSLEDRIVKHYFRDMAKKCVCPPEVPVCNCRGEAIVKVLTGKPISPSKKEVSENPPSRSAKLRVIVKVNEL